MRTARPSSASNGRTGTASSRSATTASRFGWTGCGSAIPAWYRPVGDTGGVGEGRPAAPGGRRTTGIRR
ncbi:hypothetical protein NKH77_34330 [Streptomyces sp. M19]